ncbi:hypothetical protein DQ04_07541020 [Trypanosoma grayi]|uniref:hypothetical protein n=1 Tax=Trypanosoma grayi TaxID=71804 RepID=UPI0004F47A46|nr:hypothetical protein DQ04_07541020 [Trypanosoma grayi]KEG08278.1 hypothetical protein DQ04_07541020 [Trypanosoma grayi]
MKHLRGLSHMRNQLKPADGILVREYFCAKGLREIEEIGKYGCGVLECKIQTLDFCMSSVNWSVNDSESERLS